MYHGDDNLYFGRAQDGSVRILKLSAPPKDWPQADGDYPDALFDVTLPAGVWCSAVCSVSKDGEEDGRWYEAMQFHGE